MNNKTDPHPLVEEYNCPGCGAPLLPPKPGQEAVTCGYCGASLVIPVERRRAAIPPHAPPARRTSGRAAGNPDPMIAAVIGGLILVMFATILFLINWQKKSTLHAKETQAAYNAAAEQRGRLTLQALYHPTADPRQMDVLETQAQETRAEEERQSSATAVVRTATADAGATLEAALLQTQVATLRAGLGTPQAWGVAFDERFTSSQAGWPVGEVRNAFYIGSRTIQDGAYQWRVHTKTAFFTWVFPEVHDFANGFIQAEARLRLTPEVAWGIPLRVDQANATWYYFTLRGDGKYAFVYNTSHSTNRLVDWTDSAWIDPEQNRLGVIAQGNRFTLLINDQVVDTIQDDHLDRGLAGLGLSVTAADQDVQVDFTHFTIQMP
jgi:hypothetical protein